MNLDQGAANFGRVKENLQIRTRRQRIVVHAEESHKDPGKNRRIAITRGNRVNGNSGSWH